MATRTNTIKLVNKHKKIKELATAFLENNKYHKNPSVQATVKICTKRDCDTFELIYEVIAKTLPQAQEEDAIQVVRYAQTYAKILSVSALQYAEENGQLCREVDKLTATDEEIPEEFPNQTLAPQLPLCHLPLVKMVPQVSAIPKEETVKGSKGIFPSLSARCMQLGEHWNKIPTWRRKVITILVDSPSTSFDPTVLSLSGLPPPPS